MTQALGAMAEKKIFFAELKHSSLYSGWKTMGRFQVELKILGKF
jgi:hypothetical protein